MNQRLFQKWCFLIWRKGVLLLIHACRQAAHSLTESYIAITAWRYVPSKSKEIIVRSFLIIASSFPESFSSSSLKKQSHKDEPAPFRVLSSSRRHDSSFVSKRRRFDSCFLTSWNIVICQALLLGFESMHSMALQQKSWWDDDHNECWQSWEDISARPWGEWHYS